MSTKTEFGSASITVIQYQTLRLLNGQLILHNWFRHLFNYFILVNNAQTETWSFWVSCCKYFTFKSPFINHLQTTGSNVDIRVQYFSYIALSLSNMFLKKKTVAVSLTIKQRPTLRVTVYFHEFVSLVTSRPKILHSKRFWSPSIKKRLWYGIGIYLDI